MTKDNEKKIVSKMIKIYCSKKHKKNLCKKCNELQEYAIKRVDNCPFSDTKKFCSTCKIHCYTSDKKQAIKEVMKFSGPRLIIYHPILVFLHFIDSIKKKIV
ncbi:MAG: nitrous oxide-stimulated promoter family protein [Anaerorhabdus sp.]